MPPKGKKGKSSNASNNKGNTKRKEQNDAEDDLLNAAIAANSAAAPHLVFPTASATSRCARAELHKSNGNELFKEQKLDGAIAEYSQGLHCLNGDAFITSKSQPKEIELFVALMSNRAQCWLKLQNGAEAKADAIQVIQLVAGHEKAYYRLVCALQMLGDDNSALGVCEEALKLEAGPNRSTLEAKHKELAAKGATPTPFVFPEKKERRASSKQKGEDGKDEVPPPTRTPKFVVKEETREAEDVQCAICMGVWKDPRSIFPCGHHFCKGCIVGLQMRKKSEMSKKCPLCRTAFSEYRNASAATQAALHALPGSCDDCEWEGTRKEFENTHKRHCKGKRKETKHSDANAELLSAAPSYIQQILTHITEMRQNGEDLKDIWNFIEINPVPDLGESTDAVLYLLMTSCVFIDAHNGEPSKKIIANLERAYKIHEQLRRDAMPSAIDDHVRSKIVCLLGDAYSDLDPKKAIRYFEEEKTLVGRNRGTRDLPYVLSDMGTCYQNLGDVEKSREAHEKALPLFQKLYGPMHEQVGMALGKLANVYSAAGDVSKGHEFHEKSATMLEAILGPNDPKLGNALLNWGINFSKKRDDVSAMKLFQRAIVLVEKDSGTESIAYATCLCEMAMIHMETDTQKGIELAERALRISEARYGPDHMELVSSLMIIANGTLDLGEARKALEVYKRILRTNGLQDDAAATTYVNMANAHHKLYEYEKAIGFLEKALKLKERLFGVDHWSCGKTFHTMGTCYSDSSIDDDGVYHRDRVEKALAFLLRALRIHTSHYGPNHPEVAITHYNLGLVYFKLGKAEKAEGSYLAALKIRQEFYPPHHPEIQEVEVGLRQLLQNYPKKNK